MKLNISVPTYILVSLFSMSSWITIIGCFVELPILVLMLPEAWTLPSYMSLIVQLSNISPLLYSLILKTPFCQKFNVLKRDIVVCMTLMFLTFLSTFFMIFFWDYIVYIGDVGHSIPLMVLLGINSMVSCTTSLVYLPYMANYSHTYLSAFYVGMGFSGLVPAVLTLIQGAATVSRDCANITSSNTNTSSSLLNTGLNSIKNKFSQNINDDIDKIIMTTNGINIISSRKPKEFLTSPRFSVSYFFAMLSICVVVSAISFILLNYSRFGFNTKENKNINTSLLIKMNDAKLGKLFELSNINEKMDVKNEIEDDNRKYKIEDIDEDGHKTLKKADNEHDSFKNYSNNGNNNDINESINVLVTEMINENNFNGDNVGNKMNNTEENLIKENNKTDIHFKNKINSFHKNNLNSVQDLINNLNETSHLDGNNMNEISPDSNIADKRNFIILLLVIMANNLTSNGFIPSIQSYTCLPYGPVVYSLAVRLASIIGPIVSFLAMFMPLPKVFFVSCLEIFVTFLFLFHVVIAFLSPTPPLQDQLIGGILIVGNSVIMYGIFSYIRITTASILHGGGNRKKLIWCGVMTQLGSFLGASLAFIIVNILHLLESMDPCK